MSERKKPKIKPSPLFKGEKSMTKDDERELKAPNLKPDPPFTKEEPQQVREEYQKWDDHTEAVKEDTEENKPDTYAFLDDLQNAETFDELTNTLENAIGNADNNGVENPKTNQETGSSHEEEEEEDISTRSGNYILTLGLPGSGKTTVQSFMTYTAFNYSGGQYIKGRTFPSFNLKHLTKNGAQDFSAMAIVNEWETSWKRGIFPKATPVGEQNVREIRLRFNNIQNKKQSFDLSFLEVSGEDLNTIRVNKDWKINRPFLMEKLNKFLVNPNINLNFVWVVDPEKLDENDDLFKNFMAHYETLEGVNQKKVSLMVMVTKPKLALKLLQKRTENSSKYQQMEGFNTLRARRHAAKAAAPWTVTQFDNWNKKRRGIMVFDIGETEERGGDTYLTHPRYIHSRRFIEWHYTQFTGKKFKPPFLKQFWKLLGR